MQIEMSGRRAVIAGGSRGIGRSIALAFAEAGAAVSICAPRRRCVGGDPGGTGRRSAKPLMRLVAIYPNATRSSAISPRPGRRWAASIS